jgi:hypothetical protein
LKNFNVKNFIREIRGSGPDQIMSEIRSLIESGKAVTVDVDCPDRSGYVVISDVIEPSPGGEDYTMLEGFFEDETGEDVFFLFTSGEIIPDSLEKYKSEIISEEIEYSDDRGTGPRSMTRDFLSGKIY